MPRITIKDVPPALHQRISERAAKHHRSVDREVLEALEQTFQEPHRIPPVKPFVTKFPLTQNFLEKAIREGRE